MRLYLKWKTCLVCLLLASGMLAASYWQWGRHQDKMSLIAELSARVEMPVVPISKLIEKNYPTSAIRHRRVSLKGSYKFEDEIVLRNRKNPGGPGVHVITPFLLASSKKYVLVNRGFIPLSYSDRSKRVIFHRPEEDSFVALIKPPQTRRLFAPRDPENGPGDRRVDAWLRVDIPAIQNQLPYPILPYFVEFIDRESGTIPAQELIDSHSGRDDIFMISAEKSIAVPIESLDARDFPEPAVNTYVPPGRHFGYIFEWAAMAVITLLIGIVLQLRP